jgi:hypothetical protein
MSATDDWESQAAASEVQSGAALPESSAPVEAAPSSAVESAAADAEASAPAPAPAPAPARKREYVHASTFADTYL